MLIRTLLALIRDSERAGRQISQILLRAMTEMRPRPPRTPPPVSPEVIRVDLSDLPLGLEDEPA